MDNWIPGTTSAAIRKGYISQATGFSGEVETLAAYRSNDTAKLFAANGASIYDVTSVGAIGAAVSTGYTSDRFQTANFGTPGGQFLYLVNGVDKAVLYNGTRFRPMTDGTGTPIVSITFVGPVATLTTATPHGLSTGDAVTVVGAAPADYNVVAAPITVISPTVFRYTMATTPATNATAVGTYAFAPSIQGIDTALFKDVNVYGRRLWFTEKNSFRIWYLGIESIAGAASSIDLAPLFILGGSLQGMVVWTVASELATISYAVFVSSEGEAVMYQGFNPDDPTNFILAGTFRVGKPIGQRFWERIGTDTILITEDGIIPLSKAVFTNRMSQSDAISYKITNLINTNIQDTKNEFGWEAILYPLGNILIVNAPQLEGGGVIQYVMNTINNQWCRYVGQKAFCWCLFEDGIYYGSLGAVYKAETGFSDNGAGIVSDILPAYSYFGATGEQKLFTAVRPIIISNGTFRPSIGLALDFVAALPSSDPTLSQGNSGSLWDVSPWDITGWGDEIVTSTNWQTIGGIGFAASIRMQAITKDLSVSWSAIDYAWEVGTGVY